MSRAASRVVAVRGVDRDLLGWLAFAVLALVLAGGAGWLHLDQRLDRVETVLAGEP